jgi:hypothetical protein
MRVPRAIVLVAFGMALVLAVGLCLSPIGPASPYRRFRARDAEYYSRLARACDSVLAQHPGFTKYSSDSSKQVPTKILWADANDVIWEQVRLSPKDSSLPQIIRKLHPDEVLLAPKRVYIGFGVGRVAWGIIWGQDEVQTNTWTLQSNGDGLVRKVYAEPR